MTAADAPDDRADRERISARRATWAFFVTALAAGGLTAVYALGGDPQLEGALIGVTFGSLGIGCVLIAKGLLPDDPHAEARHDFGGDDDGSGTLGAGAEQARADADAEELAFEDDFMRVAPLTRRRLLRTALLAAGAAIAAAAVFPDPLARSEPGPLAAGDAVAQAAGARSPTTAGRCAPPTCRSTGSSTIFPAGSPRLRRRPGRARCASPARARTSRRPRERGRPTASSRYSKVCTHAGCPVGLYEAQRAPAPVPVPPVHVRRADGARARCSAPPPAALPQLPLALDDDGLRHRAVATSPNRSALRTGTARDEPPGRPCHRRAASSSLACAATVALAACGGSTALDRRSEGIGSARDRERLVADVRPRRPRSTSSSPASSCTRRRAAAGAATEPSRSPTTRSSGSAASSYPS